MGLKFFADHCVSNYVIQGLRGMGNEVLLLRDVMPHDSLDFLVISKAKEFDSILVSLNGDFTDIITFPPSDYNGIIALQIRNHPEITPYLLERLKNYLSAFPEMSHYKGRLFLVEVHRIRVKG